MKDKFLRTKIRDDFNKIQVPDCKKEIKNRIGLNKISQNEDEKNPSNKKTKSIFKNKFLQFGLSFSILVILLSLFVPNLISDNTKEYKVTRLNKTYATQVITLFNIASSVNPLLKVSSSEPSDTIINKVLENLMFIEGLSSKNNALYEIKKSSDKEYMYEMSVCLSYLTKDILYTIYYNENAALDEGDNEDLDEVNTIINGMICQGDNKYLFNGAKSIEGKSTEIEFKLILNSSTSTYLEVSQEIENMENEYEITYYSNSKLTKTYEVEISIVDLIKTVELSVTIGESNETYEYAIGDNEICVQYEIDETEGELEIHIIDGKYEVILSNEEDSEKELIFTNKTPLQFVL